MRETNGEPRTTFSSIPLQSIKTQAYQSFKMPASTSTVTTSDIPKNTKAARLRSSPEAETAPRLEVKEHDFFWTYTEEPHRTRRMAIIKAHPEVFHLLPSFPIN
jgi:sphingolipid delta-4 desaturase